MASGNHWPSSAASSSRPRPVIVHLTENYWLPMLLFGTSGISWRDVSFHFLLTTSHSHSLSIWSQMPGLHGNSASSQRSLNTSWTSGMLQAKTMWLQMLFPGLPFRPSVGALISLPLQLPNLQIRLTWLPVGEKLWDFNLRTFLLDLITQLYYVMCLLVGHVPLYLSPSAADFRHSSWPQPPGHTGNPQTGSPKYVWHGLGRQVGEWAKSCIACQRAKVNFHHRAPLCKYEPLLHFDHVNVDFVGPLPPSKGFTHLLTVVDRVTCWPGAIPLASTNTKDVADAFLSG